jgi:acetyl-CoA decarbonylase/synthase complex subunit epsilon
MVTEMPFDVANIPGPETGEVVAPEVIGNFISRAKRPLLIVGSEILRDDFFMEIAIALGEKGIPMGQYDFVIFFGILYYYASQMLSCIKNFATDPLVRAVSIDRYYHPNARMSFATLTPRQDEQYRELLRHVVASVTR